MEVSNFNDFVMLTGNKLVTNSRKIAKHFDKKHAHVLRDIRSLLGKTGDWGVSNFGYTTDLNPQNGEKYSCYEVTKDGFMLLAMGFTGAKALEVKLAFIHAFNTMAEFIQSGAKYVVQEAVNAKAALVAQNEVGSFHGRGLCQHKYDKPPKVNRFQLACDKLQSLQLTLPLAA